MRLKTVSFFLFITSVCFGQATWFKHLPGLHARSSLVKNDTILTTGMNATSKSFGDKYNVFLMWSSLKGDSIDYMKINLDNFQKDSTISTLMSSNYNGMNFYNYGSQQFLCTKDGVQNDRTFLMTFDKFYAKEYKLDEYTVDTFVTYLDFVLNHPSGNISFVQYYNNIEKSAYTNIYIGEKSKRVKIKDYKNFLYKKHQTTNHIVNNQNINSFFFKLTVTGANNSLEYWEDYIVKMDTLGNEVWRCQPNNRDSINPVGMQFAQKSNGNILISWSDQTFKPFVLGGNLAQANKNCTIWFAEIDTSGKVLWRKNIKKYLSYKLNRDIQHNLEHIKAILTNDGVLFVGRYAWKFWHNYLLKTDFNGNPKWYREFDLYPTNSVKGFNNYFEPYDVTGANDGGYIITGEYVSDSGNIFSVFSQLATIIKVDSFGCLEQDCQKNDSVISVKTVQKNGFKLYPNPNTGNFTIEIENPSSDLSIEVYNVIGNLVKIVETSASKKSNSIEIDSVNGIYFVKVINGEMVWNQKVIIAK